MLVKSKRLFLKQKRIMLSPNPGMNATSSVRRPMSRDSYVKNSVLVESMKQQRKRSLCAENKNKQPVNTFANVVSNIEVLDITSLALDNFVMEI
ncbi:hypothetical protein Tco_0798083 [Tanacetum coccineum]